MSDQIPPLVDPSDIDAEERRDRRRSRILLAVIFILGCAVAVAVGLLVGSAQDEAVKADSRTEQAQVEKFNLAQQVAAACADQTASALDEETYQRLCTDARTIVKEGRQGVQGIPGVQGVPGNDGADGAQGLPGIDGKDGLDGKDGTNGVDGAPGPPGADGADGAVGPPGPPGADGKDGAMGPAGAAGKDGEPPTSWVVYGPNDQVIERCERTADFDRSAPTYICTRSQPAVLPTP